ncbi:MAG TPA: VOC family protein [Solirubrobacteraceae bacterium]|nr:VOC family protein [Solirubrobacteraceae bacterium]
MSGPSPRVRLRQAVLVADELDSVERALREALQLGEPFRDPGVGEFGLRNAVFALGDCFLEIVSPIQPGTAAGRYLQRHGGDGGYMALFDLEDLDGARARAEQHGVRVVWRIDLPDISGTHLHPADMHGAIVSLDRSQPYGTWRWGGPDWTGRTGSGAPGRLASISVAVGDPASAAARWGHVLGAPPADRPATSLALHGGSVEFAQASDESQEGLFEIGFAGVVALGEPGASVEVGGVRLRSLG